MLEQNPRIQLLQIPEVLKLLYELALPMKRQQDPTTTEHLIKNKQVPEFFNNNNREINAEQAQVKWAALKAKYPLLSVIEQVPMKAECEKHERAPECPMVCPSGRLQQAHSPSSQGYGDEQ